MSVRFQDKRPAADVIKALFPETAEVAYQRLLSSCFWNRVACEDMHLEWPVADQFKARQDSVAVESVHAVQAIP